MGTSEPQSGLPESGTITCPHCRLRIAWQQKLEGKRIKCKCGNIFEGALDLDENPEAENTYDLAPDALPIAPDLARHDASVVSPPRAAAFSDGRVLSYAHARPDEVEQRRMLAPLRDLYLPIGLLVLGVAFRAGQVMVDSGRAGTGVTGALGAATVGVVLNVGLTLAAIFVASKLMAIDFGSVGAMILKSTAMAILAGAVGALIVSISPKDMTAPIVALHVVVILYWVMFYNFFEIDLQETLMTTAIVTVFQIAAFCILFKPLGQ
jgi:hypothetical protein